MSEQTLSNTENAALHFFLTGNFLLFGQAIKHLENDDCWSPILLGLKFADVGQDESKIHAYWSGDRAKESRLNTYQSSYGQYAAPMRREVDAIRANMWAQVFANDCIRLADADFKRMKQIEQGRKKWATSTI